MKTKVTHEMTIDRRRRMRKFLILGLSVFLLSARGLSYADGAVETVTTTVKENPGKSVGAA